MPKSDAKIPEEMKPRLTRIGMEIFSTGLRTAVERGDIDPRGKTDKQLFTEFAGRLRRANFNLAFVTDHTSDLLARARKAHEDSNHEIACLFFSLWIEHMLNKFIHNVGSRAGFPSKSIEVLLRETNLRGKFLWVHLSVSSRAPRADILAAISELADRRNQFVHYKWRVSAEWDDEAPYQKTLASIEKLIRYLRRFENRHFFHDQKRRLIQRPKSA